MSTLSEEQFYLLWERFAALYDACKLIVDTYDQCDILDDVAILIEGTDETHVFPSDVATFAKEVMHRISENQL